jgi:hypothetical protein
MSELFKKIAKTIREMRPPTRDPMRNFEHMYILLYNGNNQAFIDNLRKEDLELLKRVAREKMPETCDRCWFFQAYSTPPSCTLRCENPSWDSVPDDCPLKQQRP